MDDQQLCHIVHEATASGMFPRGTHSGETMAVARAVREACAKAAEAAALPEGFQWGGEAMGNFNFAKKRCAEAIRQFNPAT